MATTPHRPAAQRDPGLHPRNRHQGRYDLAALVAANPPLGRHLVRTRFGGESIDFADPAAVQQLNRAILARDYGIRGWELPPGCLCPAIPGRADYLHHLADLLAATPGGPPPRGTAVRACDIGTGASCIYPLLGHHVYGWRFLASDIRPPALAAARRILAANPPLAEAIELRLQERPERIFAGLWREDERFDLTLCNPPFHASAAQAEEGTRRKWSNLGRAPQAARNFGGEAAELWCDGGEVGFIARMIAESSALKTRCLWFTTLVAAASHLPRLVAKLRGARVAEHRVIDMAQGQKRSRILAWTFLEPAQRAAWRAARWTPATPPRPAPRRR